MGGYDPSSEPGGPPGSPMLSGKKRTLKIGKKNTPKTNQPIYYFICINLGAGICEASEFRYQSDSVVVLWVNTSLTTQESNQARGHTHVHYNYGVTLIDIRHAGKYKQYTLKFHMEPQNWWFVAALPFPKRLFQFQC